MPEVSEGTVIVPLRIPKFINSQLEKLVKNKKFPSKNEIIRTAVVEYLARHKEELFGDKGIAKILLYPGFEKFGKAQISRGRKKHKNVKADFVNFLYKKINKGPYAGNYIFIVNLDSEEKTIKVSLPELKASNVIQKWFENENIKSKRGEFSDIIDPYGKQIIKAPYFEENLVPTEIDLLKLKHVRIHATMLSDERIDIVTEELKRIAKSVKEY